MGTRFADCVGPDGKGCLAPHDCGGQPSCPGYRPVYSRTLAQRVSDDRARDLGTALLRIVDADDRVSASDEAETTGDDELSV